MTTITVSMQWEIEEGFNYHVTASEEVAAAEVAETQQHLHDLCREHRQAVQAAVDAYCQRRLHLSGAESHLAWAASELASIERHKDYPSYNIRNDVSRKSAAQKQAAAREEQAKADAIEVDEDWLPW